MQKNVRDTSILTYITLAEHLGEMTQAAYEAVKQHPYRTAKELAKKLGYTDPNKIRPRLTELKDAGLVYNPYKRTCTESHLLAYVWAAKQ
jgi:predicted HTH transcriptional regulator